MTIPYDDEERIVISGLGIVSPIGVGKTEFWAGLRGGSSGIGPVTLFDTTSTNSKLAGQIVNFDPSAVLGEKGLRNLDRTTLLALTAAHLAIEDSKISLSEYDPNEVGVVLGSTMGSVWSISEFDKEAITAGPKYVNPGLFPNTVMNSPASQISIRYGIKGFNATISSGFTSSLDALEYAIRFIRKKRGSLVLVGGVEELCEQIYKGCYKIGFLSASKTMREEICAPFDSQRNGAIIGEGAVMLIVESLKHALNRNARIYCEIRSIGTSFDLDAINKYNVRAVGAKQAISKALQNAHVQPGSVECVVAGANSTLDGDLCEARAINDLFGENNDVLVTATKSMIGETFSASGGFQLATGMFIFDSEYIPPILNLKDQDKRCRVNCVRDAGKEINPTYVVVTCFSPMGNNSCIVLSKPD